MTAVSRQPSVWDLIEVDNLARPMLDEGEKNLNCRANHHTAKTGGWVRTRLAAFLSRLGSVVVRCPYELSCVDGATGFARGCKYR